MVDEIERFFISYNETRGKKFTQFQAAVALEL